MIGYKRHLHRRFSSCFRFQYHFYHTYHHTHPSMTSRHSNSNKKDGSNYIFFWKVPEKYIVAPVFLVRVRMPARHTWVGVVVGVVEVILKAKARTESPMKMSFISYH